MFTLKVWQFNGLFQSWRMLLGMYRNDRWKSDHEATDNQINLALSFWEIKNELTRNLNFNFIEKHKRHLFFVLGDTKLNFQKEKKIDHKFSHFKMSFDVNHFSISEKL